MVDHLTIALVHERGVLHVVQRDVKELLEFPVAEPYIRVEYLAFNVLERRQGHELVQVITHKRKTLFMGETTALHTTTLHRLFCAKSIAGCEIHCVYLF